MVSDYKRLGSAGLVGLGGLCGLAGPCRVREVCFGFWGSGLWVGVWPVGCGVGWYGSFNN